MNSLIGTNFLDYSAASLHRMAERIILCLNKLPDEELWRKSGPQDNAPANLILHLCGNMRQWIMHGVAGHPDIRERDEEFSTSSGISRDELIQKFRATIAEARNIILKLPPQQLLERTRPQGHDVTKLEAIYQVVTHVEHHAGQIILLTKQFLGDDLNLTMPRKR
jgi:uncharacterized damage-inducible protein DinB